MLDEHEVKEATNFHGHICFGLCVGIAACRLAMERLGISRAKGEEIIAIVENNSCAVDAVQFIAGATIGRGNLFIKDYGKHAYTFARRSDGGAVRISLRYDAFGGISNREKRIEKVLKSKGEEVFNVRDVKIDVPPEAEVVRSVQCNSCMEPVMKTMTKTEKGKVYCIPCYDEKVYIQPSG
jgi:formylmethanofuran dehydrogenase subunit E